ncbi:MAG: hypothetical protein IJO58_03805 [Clostridia bacterium]|nr:hypothetical protein [Clostridia bacterium]MBQ9958154.1 hypothetical protein [Clostridia bacterium]
MSEQDKNVIPPVKDDGSTPNLPQLPKSDVFYESFDLKKEEKKQDD